MVKIVVLSKLPINQIFRINVLLNLWANYASINSQKNFPLLDMGPNYGLTCTGQSQECFWNFEFYFVR